MSKSAKTSCSSIAISSIAFNPYALPYLKRDILYIIAHVRGGGELGEEWHHDGRRLSKDNSIQDYLDCAASLIGEGLVAEGQIVALGESAGAIVTATAVLRRPELFRALVLRSPFLDVIGALQDETQPLTPSDRIEFGNPEQPEERACMETFSPFTNILERAYPALYITCGEKDSRIPISETLRWFAKLRDHSQDKNLKALHVRSERGHQLYTSEDEAIFCAADEAAFIIRQLDGVNHDESTASGTAAQ